MKTTNPQKFWSVSSVVNLIAVLYFSLLTYQCQKGGQEAQKSNLPPPPDDYVGALVYMILMATSVIFGLLFLISIFILIFSIVRNKPATADKN